MFDKFEKTCFAWGIVIFPAISAVIVIVDKVINLGLDSENDYADCVLSISLFVDIVLVAVVGVLLYLYDEHERKDR